MRCRDTFPSVMHCPEVRLFHSRSAAERFSRLRAGEPIGLLDTAAQSWCVQRGGSACVCVLFEAKGMTWAESAALLAHEATHCAMRWLEVTGDGDRYGEEELAYAVQHILLALVNAHNRWLLKRAAGKQQRPNRK
nr:hypothetical protein [uncultured Olsenella sp.]